MIHHLSRLIDKYTRHSCRLLCLWRWRCRWLKFQDIMRQEKKFDYFFLVTKCTTYFNQISSLILSPYHHRILYILSQLSFAFFAAVALNKSQHSTHSRQISPSPSIFIKFHLKLQYCRLMRWELKLRWRQWDLDRI